MAIYYINGTTLSNSTAVFSDIDLTTCAADGFYSDGSGIAREQVGCVLGAIQNCPNCTASCGTGPITYNLGAGVFNMDIDLGDTPSDVGAVIVKFITANIPDGIRATYNGNKYNKLSSPVDGYHGGVDLLGFTYMGVDSPPSSCAPVAGVTYPDLIEYRYDGSSFVATGNTQTITPTADELSFSASTPGIAIMVIPKVSTTPVELNVEIIGVCASTAFTIEIECPALLTGYLSSVGAKASSVLSCADPLDITYYNAPVSGVPGVPEVNDWVFYDAYGENVLPSGFYKIIGTEWIEVDSNGIVIQKGSC